MKAFKVKPNTNKTNTYKGNAEHVTTIEGCKVIVGTHM